MSAVTFLAGLPRAWISIQVPGTSSPGSHATYVAYPAAHLPALPTHAADLAWLEDAPRHPESHLARPFEAAARDLSSNAVADLLGDQDALPIDFTRFLGGDNLRDRLRSATDCYFDVGDRVVHLAGGRLLHLVSDSQWGAHWLLYLGDDGDSAMVGTPYPAGFRLNADEADYWRGESWGYTLVADTFAEFLWRWWMDNEIFYATRVDRLPFTPNHIAYVEQYGSPRLFG